MADEEINTDEEEVAKETTLQDMVEELSESNILQKSLEDSAMKTTEVLTTIAKILQAQLDLSEKEDLDDGRKFDKPSDDDDNSKSPFEKLEMPTSPAEGLGLFVAGITGLVGGYFRELNQIFLAASRLIGFETKNVKGESSKAMKRLKATLQSVKKNIFQMFNLIGRIFAPLKDLKKFLPSGGKISKLIKGFMTFFRTFGKFFQLLGRVVARLFSFIVAPIMGFIKAFEEFENQQEGGMTGKIIAGVMGFITGFLNFMVFGLIDLAKSAISWVIGAIFGEDNAVTTFLDSFTFTGLFEGLMKSIKDFIIGIPKYFTDAYAAGGGFTGMLKILLDDFKELMSNLFGFAKELFMKGLKFVTDKLGITGLGTKVWEAIVKSLDDAWIAMKGYFADAFDGLMTALGLDFTTDGLVEGWNTFWEGFIGGWKQMLGDAWNSIKTAFGFGDGGTGGVNSPASIAAEVTAKENGEEESSGGVWDWLTKDKSKRNKSEGTMDSPQKQSPFVDLVSASPQMKSSAFMSGDLGDGSTGVMGAGGFANPEDAAEVKRVGDKAEEEIRRANKRRNQSLVQDLLAPGLAQFNGIPTGIRADFRAPASALTPKGINSKAKTMVDSIYESSLSPSIEVPTGGSAVNQGQALQSGTSNLNDAKGKQNSTPPMVLQSSANNSKTTNSKVSNNYTSSNVAAWDIYDPFGAQMPSNAAK